MLPDIVSATLLIDIGRETFLVPLNWEQDWPVINGGQKITFQSLGPGLYQLETSVSWRDEFTDPEIQLGWYRKSEYLNQLPIKLG